jgi:hypothetical protein
MPRPRNKNRKPKHIYEKKISTNGVLDDKSKVQGNNAVKAGNDNPKPLITY